MFTYPFLPILTMSRTHFCSINAFTMECMWRLSRRQENPAYSFPRITLRKSPSATWRCFGSQKPWYRVGSRKPHERRNQEANMKLGFCFSSISAAKRYNWSWGIAVSNKFWCCAPSNPQLLFRDGSVHSRQHPIRLIFEMKFVDQH